MAWYFSPTPPIVRPFFCVLFIIFCCGSGVMADVTFTNLWAVKVRASQQEAEELAHKHGLSYNKHVSFTLLKASLLSPCSILPFVRAIVLCIVFRCLNMKGFWQRSTMTHQLSICCVEYYRIRLNPRNSMI